MGSCESWPKLAGIARDESRPSANPGRDGLTAAPEIADYLIRTSIGVAGAAIAACTGYLIGFLKAGEAAGLAGMVICPLVYIAAYWLPQGGPS